MLMVMMMHQHQFFFSISYEILNITCCSYKDACISLNNLYQRRFNICKYQITYSSNKLANHRMNANDIPNTSKHYYSILREEKSSLLSIEGLSFVRTDKRLHKLLDLLRAKKK